MQKNVSKDLKVPSSQWITLGRMINTIHIRFSVNIFKQKIYLAYHNNQEDELKQK